ncbi:hypothetical protein LFM09_19155, partial [Lentzea alba]|uniref:hypothetical protein n=1 Tax=Lentzea alba TaxID=2714351 RepID=UPI0039BFAE4F
MRNALAIAFAVAALLAGASTATADTTATAGAPVEASASAAACPVSGQRVKTSSSPAVYVVGPGRYLYWIPNETVYNNLFRTWAGIATYNNLFVDCYSSARTLTNGHLIKHPSFPHVYIWDGFLGHYRWITSAGVCQTSGVTRVEGTT